MRRMILGWMCGGALLSFQASAQAQFPFGGGCPGGCGGGYVQPVVQYPCAVQQPIYQTQLQPVVQTHLQPQQFMTYRDVAITQYRQEQFTTQVPVTTMQQVTRDEGQYQMVWVPRMVTHQVPQTTYQTQIGYRTVPYQATQRVAQVETRMVPQQTVQYIPRTTVAQSIGCNTCPSAAIYQQAMLPGISYGAPGTLPAAPAPAQSPAQSIESTTQQPVVPSPPPETSMHSEWQTVEPRHAAAPTDQTTSMLLLPSAALIQAQPASWSVPR